MKSVEFITSGSSSTLGPFSTGDIARNLPDDMADHLVNDAKCAKYLDPVAAPAPAAPTTPALEKPARKPRKAAAPAADPAADPAAAPELPPKDPDEKGGDNNPLTKADADADLAGQPRPE